MSWRRAKSPGWAALDLQQKQKQGLAPIMNNEPFPALPSSLSSIQPHKIYAKSNKNMERPFSSVALPSAAAVLPAHIDKMNSYKPSQARNSSGSKWSEIPCEKKDDAIFRRLKELYSCADESLIQDILAAVDCNFEKASSSLKAMASDKSSVDNNGSGTIASGLGFNRHCHEDSQKLEASKAASLSKSFSHGHLTSIPIEPEWEEDDVYLNHRKDAIRIIRAASRHSKAAANSFLRGDHFAARQLSQKAQDEWAAADNLHEKAAREILSLRNDRHRMWKLDLHGLHASEAVQALQEHLSLIEAQVFKGSLLSNNSRRSEEALNGSSNDNGHNDVEKSNVELLIRQRPVWLEVITGRGNHSRGEAAIPAAVRTFLLNNRYRFDEARPGIVMVRPKFRHS